MAASSSDAAPPHGGSSFSPDFGSASADELEAHVKEEPPESPPLAQPQDTSSLAPTVTPTDIPKESEFEKSRPQVPWVKWTQDRLDKADARHRDVNGPGQLGCVAAMAAYVRTDDVADGFLQIAVLLVQIEHASRTRGSSFERIQRFSRTSKGTQVRYHLWLAKCAATMLEAGSRRSTIQNECVAAERSTS